MISVDFIREDVNIDPANCAAIKKRPSESNFSRVPSDEESGSPGLRITNSECRGEGTSVCESGWKMLCRRRNERSFPSVSGRFSSVILSATTEVLAEASRKPEQFASEIVLPHASVGSLEQVFQHRRCRRATRWGRVDIGPEPSAPTVCRRSHQRALRHRY